jgi:hypothetical protein
VQVQVQVQIANRSVQSISLASSSGYFVGLLGLQAAESEAIYL